MLWGIINNERVKASPKRNATCPICKEQLTSKCGLIKQWHWSHKSGTECDNWSEGETEWHIDWKNQYPKNMQEVIVDNHRADIKLESGKVIELQNSSISPEMINERELFYKDMIWLINGESIAKGLILKNKTKYWTFNWKNPAKSWWISDKDIYIDISHIKKQLLEDGEDMLNRIHILYNELCFIVSDEEKNIHEWVKNNGGVGIGFKIYERYGKTALDIYLEWSRLSQSRHIIIKKIDDITGDILFIRKIYKKVPCAGWGLIMTKGEFLNKFK